MIATAAFLCAVFILKGLPARADDPLVIVIDPGHGGENRGGEYGD